MKWNFSWIIGNYTSGIYYYALCIRAFPELSPPADIILCRIFFSNIYLSPACYTFIPGEVCLDFVGAYRFIRRQRREIACSKYSSGQCGFLQKGSSAVIFIMEVWLMH